MAADDLKNVAISVFSHADTQLSGTASIDFPGVPIDLKSLTSWFQVRLSGPIPTASRLGERIEAYVLTCNCFARVGRDTAGTQKETIWKAHDLAGAFRDAFHQQDVAVQDWDGGGDPTIGWLRFEEVTTAVIVDVRETDLQQVSASVTGVLHIE